MERTESDSAFVAVTPDTQRHKPSPLRPVSVQRLELSVFASIDAVAPLSGRLVPGWNPVHYLKFAWWFFRDADTVRKYRLGRDRTRREAVKQAGKWIVSTWMWLPLFIYTLFLRPLVPIRPRITHIVLGYLAGEAAVAGHTGILSPWMIRVLIAPGWILGGIFGARRGRRAQIVFGLPSAAIAFFVTDHVVGSLPTTVVYCGVAGGILALIGGIGLGMARIARCQAAMAYTFVMVAVEGLVIVSTVALDMDGGKQFVAAASFTFLSTALVWVLLRAVLPESLLPLGDVLSLLVFSIAWMVSFLRAALSAKGDLLWAGGVALVVGFVVFLCFLRGTYQFLKIYEDEFKKTDEQQTDDEEQEYEYEYDTTINGMLMDTSSEEDMEELEGDLEFSEDDADSDAEWERSKDAPPPLRVLGDPQELGTVNHSHSVALGLTPPPPQAPVQAPLAQTTPRSSSQIKLPTSSPGPQPQKFDANATHTPSPKPIQQ